MSEELGTWVTGLMAKLVQCTDEDYKKLLSNGLTPPNFIDVVLSLEGPDVKHIAHIRVEFSTERNERCN